VIGYRRNFDPVGPQFAALELGCTGQVRGKFFCHPISRPRSHKPEGVLLDHIGCLGEGRIASHLSRDIWITYLFPQKFMKTVNLPLTEPVTLILQFIGLDPGVAENGMDIHIRMELFDVLYVVLYKAAIIEGGIYSAFVTIRCGHILYPYGLNRLNYQLIIQKESYIIKINNNMSINVNEYIANLLQKLIFTS
jgi:hypothetical protein